MIEPKPVIVPSVKASLRSGLRSGHFGRRLRRIRQRAAAPRRWPTRHGRAGERKWKYLMVESPFGLWIPRQRLTGRTRRCSLLALAVCARRRQFRQKRDFRGPSIGKQLLQAGNRECGWRALAGRGPARAGAARAIGTARASGASDPSRPRPSRSAGGARGAAAPSRDRAGGHGPGLELQQPRIPRLEASSSNSPARRRNARLEVTSSAIVVAHRRASSSTSSLGFNTLAAHRAPASPPRSRSERGAGEQDRVRAAARPRNKRERDKAVDDPGDAPAAVRSAGRESSSRCVPRAGPELAWTPGPPARSRAHGVDQAMWGLTRGAHSIPS